jgi:E3 ubiquitin-protein ligase XBAT32/33
VKRGHVACAALLNPSSAEPLVWPSALKFISELEPDAKSLLEAALMEANRERERRILKGTKNALPSPPHHDDGAHDTAIAEVNSESSVGKLHTDMSLCCCSSWRLVLVYDSRR